MSIAALIILITCIIIGFFLILLGFPGTAAIFIGILVYDLLLKSFALTFIIYALLGLLIVLGELFDILVASLVAKRFQTSNWGIAGMIVGGIIGAFMGSSVPIIGNLIGLVIGAAAGTLLVELILRKDFRQAIRAAKGAVLGKAGAIVFKTVIGIIMVLLAFG